MSCKGYQKNEARHYEQIAVKAVEQYAPIIVQQAREHNVQFPLSEGDARQLLDNTISGLEKGGSLDWSKTRGAMREVFITAWGDAMRTKGIL
jgi:hypothetical protein